MKQELEEILTCQICGNKKLKFHIKAADHNVSGDYFSICECVSCGYRFTNPRPEEQDIGAYYKSDDYVSHNSTKKGFINKVYHIVRAYQFRVKHKTILKLKKSEGKDLLDVGCGTGDFMKYMKHNGWAVEGVEADDTARGVAHKNGGSKIVDSIYENGLGKYDVITMWHVLEHVYDLDKFFNRLKSLLKEDGVLVIGVPNCESYDAKYYKSNWFAYDLPIHLSHFRKADIKNISIKYGFILKHIKPLIFDAYYISMLSEKKSKKITPFGILIGFISNIKAKKSGEYSSLAYFLFK